MQSSKWKICALQKNTSFHSCFNKGKGKDVPVLQLSTSYEGVLGEWRYNSTHSLTSALDGGEWSDSRTGRFTPRERAPGTHWIGGWVGPRAVLDAVVKRKIPSPRRKSNHRTPIFNPVAQRCTTEPSRLLLMLQQHVKTKM
jgi:hypothetical protein